MPYAIIATAQPANLFGDLLPWIALLLGLVVIGGVIIALARRFGRSEWGAETGFTLHELRSMHAAGELTDEEFEHAKAALIGRTTATARSAGPGAGTGNDDPGPRKTP